MKKIRNWYKGLNRSQIKSFWMLIVCMGIEVGLIVWNLIPPLSAFFPWILLVPVGGFVFILIMLVKLIRRWALLKEWDASDRAWENMFRKYED